jgi:hypothetical protein
MVIIPFNLCQHIKGKLDMYEAYGYHIEECHDNNRDKHVDVDDNLSYYNINFLKYF